jgi:hypothetical protein
MTLYVVSGVPEDFPFKTQTRKEIGVRLISLTFLEELLLILRPDLSSFA